MFLWICVSRDSQDLCVNGSFILGNIKTSSFWPVSPLYGTCFGFLATASALKRKNVYFKDNISNRIRFLLNTGELKVLQ